VTPAGPDAEWQPGSPVRLETERYVLRSLEPGDVDDAYLAWFRDPALVRFIGPDLAQFTPEQHRAVARSLDNRTRFLLLVSPRAGGAPLGFLRAEVAPKHRRAQTTVAVADISQRGLGAMAECHRALRLFLFEKVDVQKIAFSVYGSNELMLRQIPKYDIVREGILRRHEWLPGVGWQDVHLFAMWRADARPERPSGASGRVE
jgi:RimJ/RimL family protein N-acetyltransferase